MKSFVSTIAGLAMFASTAAIAAPLYVDGGFGPGSTTITFDEVALSEGDAIGNQFAAFGATFGGGFSASGATDMYSGILQGFTGRYIDTFSDGTSAAEGEVFSIVFDGITTQAGAYFEFNASAPAATFEALLDGVVVDSFAYNNTNCCGTSAFLGFTGISFDTLRFQVGSGRNFVMDTLTFNAVSQQEVPEPAALGLVGLGLLGIGAVRRRRA